jgi:hypothetical protein
VDLLRGYLLFLKRRLCILIYCKTGKLPLNVNNGLLNVKLLLDLFSELVKQMLSYLLNIILLSLELPNCFGTLCLVSTLLGLIPLLDSCLQLRFLLNNCLLFIC